MSVIIAVTVAIAAIFFAVVAILVFPVVVMIFVFMIFVAMIFVVFVFVFVLEIILCAHSVLFLGDNTAGFLITHNFQLHIRSQRFDLGLCEAGFDFNPIKIHVLQC